MSLDDRTEWLIVATEAIGHIPASLLAEACRAVQTKCDHPAKIVPAICAYADENRDSWEWRNRPQVAAPRLTVVPAPRMVPSMTQEEVDMIVAERGMRMSIERDRGAIIKRPDGTFAPGLVPDRNSNQG